LNAVKINKYINYITSQFFYFNNRWFLQKISTTHAYKTRFLLFLQEQQRKKYSSFTIRNSKYRYLHVNEREMSFDQFVNFKFIFFPIINLLFIFNHITKRAKDENENEQVAVKLVVCAK
jgi:hypothetical protein